MPNTGLVPLDDELLTKRFWTIHDPRLAAQEDIDAGGGCTWSTR